MTGPAVDSYSLRPARAAEFRQLQQIERAAAQRFPPGRVNPDDTLGEASLANHLYARWLFCVATYQSGAAAASDMPVGFIAAVPVADLLYLKELSVHPAHGQRGLGRRLLRFCVARARRQQFSVVALTTFADLPWNAPFYRRLGFTDCDETTLPAFLAAQLDDERCSGLSQRIAMQLSL